MHRVYDLTQRLFCGARSHPARAAAVLRFWVLPNVFETEAPHHSRRPRPRLSTLSRRLRVQHPWRVHHLPYRP